MSEQEPKPEMIEALLKLNTELLPLVECAEGFRATLVERGWPTADAQQCATLLMLKFLTGVFDKDDSDDDD